MKISPRNKNAKLPDVDAIIAAVEADDNLGFCILCGAECFNIEPDGCNLPCESCGEKGVFGAEQLLLYVAA